MRNPCSTHQQALEATDDEREKVSARVFLAFSKFFGMARVADSSTIQGPDALDAGNPTATNVGPRPISVNLNAGSGLQNDTTLPQALANLSAEQRRRLEARRICERAIEANKMLETRLAHVIIPLRMLCLLIFAIELLQQLNSNSNNYQHFSHSPWYVIMIPLWVSNVLKMIFHSIKLKLIYDTYRQYHRAYWESNAYRENEIELVDFHGIGVSLQHLTNDLGSIGTKYFIAALLEGDINSSLAMAFMPTWISIGIGSIIKFCTPLDENVAAHVRHPRAKRAYDTIMYAGISSMVPLIICTKVSGENKNSWAMNFFPLWFLCLVLAVTAFVMLPIYACNIMMSRHARLHRPRRERIRLCSMIMVFIYGIGTTSIFFFVFLLFLSRRLDGNQNIKHSDFMIPLIAMSANLMLFSPIARYVLHRLNTEDDIDIQRLAPEITDPNIAAGRISYGDNTEGLFSAISTPVFLLQSSSTLFQRISETDPLVKGIGNLSKASILPMNTEDENGGATQNMQETSDANGSQDYKENISKEEDESTRIDISSDSMPDKEANDIDTKQGEKATENTLPLCFVCVDKEADGVIMPCGHGGLCFRCGLILARKVGDKICPICRSNITEVLKIDAHASEPTADGKLILVAKEGMRVNTRPSNSNNDAHDDAGLVGNEASRSTTSADYNNESTDGDSNNNRTVQVSDDTEDTISAASDDSSPAVNDDDEVGSVGNNALTQAGTDSVNAEQDSNESNINVLATNNERGSQVDNGTSDNTSNNEGNNMV